ncbi:hypothetical protein ACFSQ0_01100 [Mesonia sediminis]|uniref:Lipoprotein n=1 Tax=Mesonia sediminis TaxID=1703946 RepID=A0ABW5S9U9_9FLAO
MGTKLNPLILFLLLISCKTEKVTNDTVGSTEKEYVIAFKKSVLMGCLNEITNNEFGKSLYNEYNDIGLYTEVAIISHGNVDYASSLGSKYYEKLEPVNYPDVTGKKQGYSKCINYAFYNEEIDSIAKAKYRKLKNANMGYEYD